MGMAALKSELRTLIQVTRDGQGVGSPAVPDIDFPIIPRDKVHIFAVTYSLGQITITSAADNQFAYAFNLAATNAPTDFSNLFDQYRIQQVRVHFISLENAQNTTITSSVHTVIDYDDNNVISVAQAQQYGTYQVSRIGQSFSRTLLPRPAGAVYSGTFTSFSNLPASTWLDVASPSVLYYGLKGIIPASTFTSGPYTIFDVTAEIIVQARNNR
jgi:hypothetical protein